VENEKSNLGRLKGSYLGYGWICKKEKGIKTERKKVKGREQNEQRENKN